MSRAPPTASSRRGRRPGRLEAVVREFGRFDAKQQHDHLELYERVRNAYRSRLARS